MDAAQFKVLADARINNANNQREEWKKRFEATSKAVEKELETKTKSIIKNEASLNGINEDAFIQTLPEYKILLKENDGKDMDVDKFLEKVKEKNLGLHCDIIGRFTAVERMDNGTDSFDKKLEDAYDLKNSKKTGLKERANAILKLYDEVLKQNEQEIQKLEEGISKNKSAKLEKENKRNETVNKYKIKGKLSPEEQKSKEEELNKLDKEIKDISDKIEKDKEELKIIKTEQVNYESAVQTAKNEFADLIKDTAHVDVGNYDVQQAAPSDNGTNSAGISSNNAIRTAIRTTDSNKEIAKKMLLDIRNMDTAQRATLINQYGYEDLYEMAKNLGILGRRELKAIIDQSMDSSTFKISGLTIKKGKIENKDIEKIEKEIQKFMADIDSKTYNEIREFEAKVEKINLIALSQAASITKFGQFFKRFTSSGINFNNLNLALKKFSNMRYDRETAALNAANTMRTKIHVAQVKDSRPRTYVDKKKTNPIRDERTH